MEIVEIPNWDRSRTIEIRLSDFDIVSAPVTPIDLAVIQECGHSGLISDKLLALHVIARAVEKSSG